MKKLMKYFALTLPLIFVEKTYSQNADVNEHERIEQVCREKNEANLERIRSFGVHSITPENLLAQCIRNATEISTFNRSNTIVNTQELYDQTFTTLYTKLNELRNLEDSESKRQFACFQRQRLALLLARNSVLERNADDSFLRRALITTNNLLNNNCKRLIE